MAKIGEKLAALVLGCIILLVTLEIFLRLIGYLYDYKAHADKRTASSGAYTILCLGDSFTFGVGAPADLSYPKQLETLLNRASGARKFAVINRGQGGQNSSQLLANLPRNLEAIKPDMVILMTGSANNWNFYGFKPGKADRQASLSSQLQDFWYRIRVYKLIKLLYLNLKDKWEALQISSCRNTGKDVSSFFQQGQDCLAHAKPDDAIQCFKAGIALNPADDRLYNGIGVSYQRKQNYDEALKWLKKAVRLNPEPGNYHDLALVYSDKQLYQEAIDLLHQGISKNRDKRNINVIYFGLGEIYLNMRNYPEALAWFHKTVATDASSPYGYRSLGRVYAEMHDYPTALKWYKIGAKVDPGEKENVLKIGEIYLTQGKADEAITWLHKALRLDPGDCGCLRSIGFAYEISNRDALALSYYRKALKLTADPGMAAELNIRINTILNRKSAKPLKPQASKHPNPSPNENPPQPDASVPERLSPLEIWLSQDIQSIITACKNHDIKVILMNFPDGLHLNNRPCSPLLQRLAQRNSIPYMDHELNFRNLTDRESYFAPDKHCNAKGYGLMAQSLCNLILRLQNTPVQP